MVNIGQRIRYLRTTSGLSQVELGKRIGISAKVLSKYENGLSEPKLDIILSICELFDCDANFLVGMKNQYRSKNIIVTNRDLGILDDYHALDPQMQSIVDKIFEVNNMKNKNDRFKTIKYVAED